MLPQDPVILLSVVNTRLRDTGDSLVELCAREGAEVRAVREKLERLGYSYRPQTNQVAP